MRWRIGLLQDSAALERQAQRDAAKDAAAKKKEAGIPTVKTEAQAKADEKAANKTAEEIAEEEKHRPKPKIRPLSEAKAIETGANFLSETFLFGVAASLIIFETWRSRRKESNRRDVVKDRLDDLEESERAARQALIELEKEVLELRAQHPEIHKEARPRILPKQVYEPPSEDNETDEVSKSWYSRIAQYIGTKDYPAPEPVEPAEQKPQGPAAKILAESDRVLDERHKKQAAEDAAAAGVKEPTSKQLKRSIS